MAISPQENQGQTQQAEQKPSDKELNFRALEAKYKRELEQERQARQEAERIANEAKNRHNDDDDDNDPYVDKRKLDKKLANSEERIRKQTQSEIQQAVQIALANKKQEDYIKANPDFFEVLKNHANKLQDLDPELAETILEMPEGFERQKLVYKNVKALGLHKPPEKQPSIQEKIDANRRSPYYQPSGLANAGYANTGDFSEAGQKNAYNKMKELQKRLRI